MSQSGLQIGPGPTSRFRAVVVASLRVKQLRRGSEPRIEMDDKKHKHTSIAMEEVRRGLINITSNGMGDLKRGVEVAVPIVGSGVPFNSLTDQGL